MADINVVKAVRDGSALFTVTTGAATQTYTPSSQDEHSFVYVENTHDLSPIDVVFKMGDGIRTSNDPTSLVGDLTVSVAAGAKMLVGPFDSMRFVNCGGENAGKIVITTASATASSLKLAAVELP